MPGSPTNITVAAPSCHAVWRQYALSRDARLRDRLVFTLAPLVREAGVDAAFGLSAVLSAVESYDPAVHGSLEGHAWRLVRVATAG